jgi:hypothetical protein
MILPVPAPHSAIPFAAATLRRVTLAMVFATSAAVLASAASARVLSVGPGLGLTLPSQAAAVARDGDAIRIAPGTYSDCALWNASRLTIEATAPGVTIAGRTCQDRGIFVILGANTTIRGITFAGSRGAGHNSAGILGIGTNLTVERSRFLDNENGILMGGLPDSALIVRDSEFRGNGSCEGACAHGIYAGAPIKLLRIERCVFEATRTAHHIKSRARTTVISDSRIEDGPAGTASYLIDLPNGGDALIEHNILEKGPLSGNPSAAISIGTGGVTNPTESLIVRGNQFVSDLPGTTVFVRNHTTVPVELTGNTVAGRVVTLTGPGTVQ